MRRDRQLPSRASWCLAAAAATVVLCGSVSVGAARAAALPAAVDAPGFDRGQVFAAVRPREIIFTPTAGGPVFGTARGNDAIRWTSWGRDRAVGAAVISVDTGVPNLAAGYRRVESATITLTHPKRLGGHLLFTRMSLSKVKTLRTVNAEPVPLRYRLAPHGYWGKGYGWASIQSPSPLR